MMLVFEILVGVLPAVPTFWAVRKVLISMKPTVVKTKPTNVSLYNDYLRGEQRVVEGRVAPKAVEKSRDKKEKVTVTVMEKNYQKWANNPVSVPVIQDAIVTLKNAASMASSKLSVEELHNLEVISNQTETLITNWYATPEQVRSHARVGQAFTEQLDELKDGLKKMEANVSDNLVRNLQIETGFIQSKFQD